MTTEPLRTVRDHLSEYVDRAESEHERVVVTRNGRPAEEAVASGDVVQGIEAVRNLRPPS